MKLSKKLLELLGQEVFDTISDKIKSLDDEYLSDADWREEILNKVLNQKKDLEDKISELQEKIRTVEEKEAKITELNEKIEKLKSENLKMQKDSYVNSILEKYCVKDPDYIKFKLNVDALEMKDGKIEGLEDKIKGLKSNDSFKSFFGETKTFGFDKDENPNREQTNSGKLVITSIEQIDNMTEQELIDNMAAVDEFIKNQGI